MSRFALARLSSFALTLGLSASMGCGLPTAGCDFRSDANSPEQRCQERTGVDAPAFAGTCTGLGAEAIDGPCPTGDIVGGCVITSNVSTTVTDWYYAPLTSDDVQSECSDGEIVAAP